MYKYIKASNQYDNATKFLTIDIVYDEITEKDVEIFSSEEFEDVLLQILYHERIEKLEEVASNAKSLIQFNGLVFDYKKDSPRNNEFQESYYLYFHHPKFNNSIDKHELYIEVRLKITDHTYTTEDGKFDISRYEYTNNEGLEKERQDLETRLQRAVPYLTTIKDVLVNDKSFEGLTKAFFDINDRLKDYKENVDSY